MIFELLALSPDQNTLAIAVLIPILGVISPLLIARQINKNTERQKELDWARQDEVSERAAEVANKAAEAADRVVLRQEVLDKKTDEVARLVAESTTSTNSQLIKIHGLVNSQMTEAIRSELHATKDTLEMMRELIENHKKAGLEPTIEVLAAYRGRETKVKELAETLSKREEADKKSEKPVEGTGPTEVVIVNPDPVPVIDRDLNHESVEGGRRAGDRGSGDGGGGEESTPA